MFDTNIKDVGYYNENKRKFNKLYNFVWKKIAGPRYIGLCSYLFQTFYSKWRETNDHNPSIQDFADYYFSHTNPTKNTSLCRDDSLYYGRTVEDIISLAKHYQERCNDYSIPLEQYYDDIVNHAIVETFNGQMREILLINEYERHGYKAEHTSGKWDKDLGVDFIIRDKRGTICDYIQCKPISTFTNTTNKSLIADRVNFFHKETDKKTECERNKMPYYPTKFIMYNTDHPNKWATLNGKRGFLLEELIHADGTSKIDLRKIEYK